jgi:hypothetical protein
LISLGQLAWLAEHFWGVCHASAPSAEDPRLRDEKVQLFRVLLDVFFGPIAKRLCHARKEQGMPGCASWALAISFA